MTHIHFVSKNSTLDWTFDHNCGKCRPIFKILSLIDSQRNSITIAGSFISPEVCCYTTLRNSKIWNNGCTFAHIIKINRFYFET